MNIILKDEQAKNENYFVTSKTFTDNLKVKLESPQNY